MSTAGGVATAGGVSTAGGVDQPRAATVGEVARTETRRELAKLDP